MTDIEGVAGVSGWEQTRVQGAALESARGLLTEEINSFVRGVHQSALDAQERPPKISIWDGHGHGGTEFESLDRRAEKFRYDDPRGFSGLLDLALEASPPADALAFVGQHAMEGSGGNLAHTYSSRRIRSHLLNGRAVGEFDTRALHAWSLGLPTIFLSGDDIACEEARALVPGIVLACVKRSTSVTSAIAMSFADARELIATQAQAAARLDLASAAIEPTFLPEPPFEYRKVRKPLFGVLPRRDVTLRGDDLVDLLRQV